MTVYQRHRAHLSTFFILTAALVASAAGSAALSRTDNNWPWPGESRTQRAPAVAAAVNSPFVYRFTVAGELQEAGTMNESSSPYWWVNSGATMLIQDGRGKTIQGILPTLSRWRILYATTNPLDTDNGFKPQNIFRLVTRSRWKGNVSQEVYFRINRLNLSDSPNRNASNGLLLFNRYKDGDNLYYTGIRVDGTAIIKKKLNGRYYTMAKETLFANGDTYNRDTSPNFLPLNTWLGVRAKLQDNRDGSVMVQVYVDQNWTGNWKLVAEAIDNGSSFGPVISGFGYAGLRTDFMDVEFDNFQLANF